MYAAYGVIAAGSAVAQADASRRASHQNKPQPAPFVAPAAEPLVNPETVSEDTTLMQSGRRRSLKVDLNTGVGKNLRVNSASTSGDPGGAGLQVRLSGAGA